jgi:adenylate cyclase
MDDGVLIEFGSAVEAVQCAVDLQRAMQEANEGLPDDRVVLFRIGINLGDVVIEESGDIFGDGVNVAARLEGLAEPGGVCVSAPVRNEVHGRLNIDFEDGGEVTLKNLARPLHVYRVQGTKSSATLDGRKRDGEAKPSIAILPFVNMSGDPEQEHFADGIAEDLITQLSRVRDLLVIARNSTFVFKGRPVRVQDVARDLGVRFVLEGSVRRAGNRIRITAQLIDASTGGHLWAERYDRELTDFFEMQDEITKAVTVALQVTLTDGEAARIEAEGTRNLQAWEAFLQAKAARLRFTKLDNFRAQRFLEQALLHDPDYGLALVELALTHWLDARFRHTPDPAASLAQAKTILSRAEKIIGETGPLLRERGNIALSELRHDEALALHYRAVKLAPSDAYCAAVLGMTQIYSGDLSNAIGSLKASLRLSPYGINYVIYYLGFAYLWLGDLDQASEHAAQYLEREPQEPFAYLLSAITAAAADRSYAAKTHVAALLTTHPEMTCADFAHAQFYRDPKRLELLVGWLKSAGMPER